MRLCLPVVAISMCEFVVFAPVLGKFYKLLLGNALNLLYYIPFYALSAERGSQTAIVVVVVFIVYS